MINWNTDLKSVKTLNCGCQIQLKKLYTNMKWFKMAKVLLCFPVWYLAEYDFSAINKIYLKKKKNEVMYAWGDIRLNLNIKNLTAKQQTQENALNKRYK